MKIRIGRLDRTPEEAEKIIREDWDDRRTQKGQTGNLTYGAGEAFHGLKAQLDEFTENYIAALREKIDQRAKVTPTEIENVRTLEKLSLMTKYDPEGERCKSHLRKLDNPEVTRATKWKVLELQAKHEGLLAGYSGEVRVKKTHRHAELGHSIN